MTFEALSFEDIRQQVRLEEANHCHGAGRGHPCETSAGKLQLLTPRERKRTPLKVRPCGVRTNPPRRRTWPKFDSAGRSVTETWSEVAREKALEARRAAAQQLGGLASARKDRERGAASAAKAEKAKAGGKGKKSKTPEEEAEAEKKRTETAAKQQSAAARKKVSDAFDVKISASAEALAALAQRSTSSPEYRQAYAAHQALLDEKRTALGGARRVQAPTKEPTAKDAKAEPAVVKKKKPADAGHYVGYRSKMRT